MTKKQLKKNLFCLPWTQAILGTITDNKINYMALDWFTRVNYQPVLIGITVNKLNNSANGILENKEFSINIPSSDLMEKTDLSGIVSSKKNDKSKLFEVFYGDLKKAPLIKECLLSIECRLEQVVELPTNYFFIGEVSNIFADEDKLNDKGQADYKKIDPFLLTMPDNNFWKLGNTIGKAWSAGVELKKQLFPTK